MADEKETVDLQNIEESEKEPVGEVDQSTGDSTAIEEGQSTADERAVLEEVDLVSLKDFPLFKRDSNPVTFGEGVEGGDSNVEGVSISIDRLIELLHDLKRDGFSSVVVRGENNFFAERV